MRPAVPMQAVGSQGAGATQQVESPAALQTSFPGALPSFDFSSDVLDGFEQYMDATPNVPAASFAVQGFGSAQSAEADTAFSADPPSQQLSSSQRRMHKNKLAQKRFRDRQKASAAIFDTGTQFDH